MSALFRGKTLIAPLVIIGLGAMTVASAQTVGSPFAKKNKKQAWETDVPVPSPAPVLAPNTGSYPAAPAANPFQESARRQIQERATPAASPYMYQPNPQSSVGGNTSYNGNGLAGAAPTQPVNGSAYYPGREGGGAYDYQAPQVPNYGAAHNSRPYQGTPQAGQQGPYSAPGKTSWKDKFGLRHLKTTFNGFLRGGVAATEADGWRDDYIGEVNIDLGVSAITQGGMEYGINVEARAQYDRYRRGFGGRVGDCPATVVGCASTLDGGVPTGLRGHTSQFYSDGPNNVKEGELALEGAYLFLRSAYGDVTLGRDDGAAYLFSLGAPTLLAVNASNSPLDYTGLGSVKTVNDASGFSEKITYTSPRLLGDQIGVGVQLGASYALNARACGVDYCVRRNSDDESGTLAPDLEDVIEVGLSLDRKFSNGLKVEATATYATAQNEIALAGFDDLQAWNTGLEISLGDWTAGGSYLQSNNALSDGDYTAWDAGVTWKPSAYGFSASYGHANDKNVNLESDQFVFGVTREFNKFTLGTGVQYIERTVPFATGGVVTSEKEKATALFIEGGFKF